MPLFLSVRKQCVNYTEESPEKPRSSFYQ
jgi:hypothetical protein